MYMHMDRAIFHLKASIPATSLYILICSMLDEGEEPTLERARQMWNGTEENFHEALTELNKRGILEPAPSWVENHSERLYLNREWRRIV